MRSHALRGGEGDEVERAQVGGDWLARLAPAQGWELIEIARKAASEYDLALAVRFDAEARRRELTGDDSELALGLCASIPLPP